MPTDALAPADGSDVAAHCRRVPNAAPSSTACTSADGRGRCRPLPPRSDAWQRIERALRANNAGPRSSRWSMARRRSRARAGDGHRSSRACRRPRQRRRRRHSASSDALDGAVGRGRTACRPRSITRTPSRDSNRLPTPRRARSIRRSASTLEKNLTVIDQAISESRAALRSEPSSEPAQASLLESFKAKISLLQDTVALVNEMRRGAVADVSGRRAGTG